MRGRWYPLVMFALATFLMIGWYWYSDRFLYQPMTIEDMLKKVEKNPNNAEAQYRAGEMYRRLGRPEQAKEALARAVRLAPDHPEYHTGLGEALLDHGEGEAAAGEFSAAAKLDPGNPFPLYRAAVACRTAGDLARAREMLDRSLHLIPTLSEEEKGLGDEARAREERIVAFQRKVLDELALVDRLINESARPSAAAAGTARPVTSATPGPIRPPSPIKDVR